MLLLYLSSCECPFHIVAVYMLTLVSSLAFADTAASTIGRLWGSLTPPLPSRLFGLPLAPRKSVAGFIAGTLTGAAVIAGFWGWAADKGVAEPLWTWDHGLVGARAGSVGGWAGLGVISLVGGLISGVAEALGE